MARTISDGNIRIMVLCLGGLFALLALRLAQVQCFSQSEELGDIGKLQSGGNRTRLVHIPQQRGHIFDRNHVPLTGTHRYYQVFVDPVALAPEQQWAAVTNLTLWFPTLEAQSLYEKISAARDKGRKYMVIGSTEEDSLAELVRRLGGIGKPLRGLGVTEHYRREYPMGDKASHVVGFVNRQGKGLVGIEKQFDKWLTGAPGHKWIYVNAMGREIRHRSDGYLAPRNGVDIELTLDHYLQHIVDSILDAYWRQTQSLAAWAIVYDCKTGEILAMVNRPTVDPDHPGDDFSLWHNRCISFRYEPGSVMKTITITGALSAGIITPSTIIDTGRGPMHFGGYPLRDHFDGPGCARDFIRKSSNKGTALIALRMERELLAHTLQSAGFGSRTGIELPAESSGNLGRPTQWSPLNLTRICLGQSVDVTALQLACAYGAIANQGIRMRPHIIQRITDPASGIVLREFQPDPIPEPVFSPAAAKDMLGMLESVVTVDPETRAHGTGRRAAIQGYRVGGKTGTAQMLIQRRYSTTDYRASFCGILPIENPRYVIVVTLERPLGLHGGGDVAAPAFAEIALQTARRFELPTDLYSENVVDLGEPDPDPEGILDPFLSRDPTLEPNYEPDLPEPTP